MFCLFSGVSDPSWSSQGFVTQMSGSSSNDANPVLPATAPEPVGHEPAGSSTEPCRFIRPVFEPTGPSTVRPFDFNALFIKWTIDSGVEAEYMARYINKDNHVLPSEPDPYDYPAFLEYAEAESNIRDAEEFEEYSRDLRRFHDHIPQEFQAKAPDQVMARRIYDCMDFESRGP
jgi:hypothetical protein